MSCGGLRGHAAPHPPRQGEGAIGFNSSATSATSASIVESGRRLRMAAAALAACLAASCALGGIAAGSGGAGEPGLAAAAPASASYHFLALGDYGASFETGRVKKGTPPPEDTCSTSAAACTAHGDKSCGADPEQAALGQQMGAYAEAHGVGHVVLLGDNFYSSGIHSHDVSCRFARTFEDIYNGSALDVRHCLALPLLLLGRPLPLSLPLLDLPQPLSLPPP